MLHQNNPGCSEESKHPVVLTKAFNKLMAVTFYSRIHRITSHRDNYTCEVSNSNYIIPWSHWYLDMVSVVLFSLFLPMGVVYSTAEESRGVLFVCLFLIYWNRKGLFLMELLAIRIMSGCSSWSLQIEWACLSRKVWGKDQIIGAFLRSWI